MRKRITALLLMAAVLMGTLSFPVTSYASDGATNYPLNSIVIKIEDIVTHQMLGGARFEIYFSNEAVSGGYGTLVATVDSDSSGVIVISGLPSGYYIVRQTMPPNNYQLSINNEQHAFIKADGTSIVELVFSNYRYGGLAVTLTDSDTGVAVQWEMIPQAKNYAAKALLLEPDSLDAQAMCGLIALYEQNYEQAQKYYEGILKEEPNNFYGINGLALALCEQQDQAKVNMGLAYARRNAEANSQSIDALSTYAWALLKTGDVDLAETVLNRVQNSGVISAAGAYYLAEIKQLKGDGEQAAILANAALSTKNNYPKKTAAQELLLKLQR